jgi:pSer/pThr/pTyr-binding forkhead associated (FHA) protein
VRLAVIETPRQGLSTKEGMMNCPACGQAVLTGTRFCSYCGFEISGDEDQSPMSDGRTVLETEPVPYLLITTGPGRGQTFELRGEVHLGRSRTNAVALSDGKVSRNHARLEPVRGTYILIDLGSANGTFVNGVRVSQPVRLRDGDILQAGDTQLVFHTHPIVHPPQIDRAASYSPLSPGPTADPEPASGNPSLSLYDVGKLPTWVWIGCVALIILIILIVVTLTTGILIGQGLGGG